jgi:hypothetical protein
MKIGLHDSDKTSFPNLALMKLSAWHKKQGDDVSWFIPLLKYDRVYSSKVFTYTPMDPYLPTDTLVIKGGLGHDYHRELSFGECVLKDEIEHICPDYDLYDINYSIGFLTRGCIRSCKHCLVPNIEGMSRGHADFTEFVRHDSAVFMDPNVLASEHGIRQIEKIAEIGLKIDFNQGLDARLIDATIARLFSRISWLKPLRLSCDSSVQIKNIHKAVELLRWYNVRPSRYFCYALIQDVEEALERIKFLKGLNLDVFAQPYRDLEGTEPPKKQKILAKWVDQKVAFNSVIWEEYWQAHR